MQAEWLKSRVDSRLKVSVPADRTLFKDNKRAPWLAGLPSHVEFLVPETIPSMIAVGGGKGGVGKSVISANLAAKLAGSGLKVLLVDLDIGGANLHTYFGMGLPKKTLVHMVLQGSSSLEELILPTPIPGVFLLPGGQDESWSDLSDFGMGTFSELWEGVFYAKERQGIDCVIFDLGAGIHRHTIDFFCAAHLGIIAVLPEPTSIENAYSFLRAFLWRLIENTGLQSHRGSEVEDIKKVLFGDQSSSGSYVAKLRSLEEVHPQIIRHIYQALSGRLVGFVVNQIRSQKDIDVAQSMSLISNNFFGFSTLPLGYLNYDDAAWKSLRNRRLLVSDFPHSILSRRLSEISSKILSCLGYQ
jgi:flagellar biosynthesis protein FlhG